MINKYKLLPLYILVFITFIMLPGQSPAEDAIKEKAAVLDFTAYNTSDSYAGSVRDIFEVNLYKTKAFNILERKHIDVILKEHNYNNKNCSDKSCAVEIGELISADKVIIGSINYIDEFTITIKIVDVKKGFIVYADSESASEEKGIMDAAKKIAERAAAGENIHVLSENKQTEQPETDKTQEEGTVDQNKNKVYSPSSYYLRAVVPGWGQLYSGRKIKGIIFISGFLVAGAYTGYAVYDFKKKRKDYEELKTGESADFDRKHEISGDAFKMANIAIGVCSAVYLLSWVDILFFSKPDFDKAINAGFYHFKNTNFNLTFKDANSEIGICAFWGKRF